MAIALITGATSGIGREFVRQIRDYRAITQRVPAAYRRAMAKSQVPVMEGIPPRMPAKARVLSEDKMRIDTLWFVGRNAQALSELEAEAGLGFRCRSIRCDLSKKTERDALIREIEALEEPIALLVNAAGLGIFGQYADLPVDTAALQNELNVTALLELTHAALPKMAAGSRLINIASSASFCPLPRMAIYAATKAYVRSFSRALREEVKRYGIVVTTVCPGTVKTAFFDTAYQYGRIESLSNPRIATTPDKIAMHALRAAEKGRHSSVWSVWFKFGHVFSKLLPTSWTLAVFRWFAH